jgi:hypothetical protein
VLCSVGVNNKLDERACSASSHGTNQGPESKTRRAEDLNSIGPSCVRLKVGFHTLE